MNLARHAAVLWRFRAVTAAGLLLGLVLAVLASYELPSFEQRGTSVYTSESQILVTQRGFPEGRVVLPQVTAPGTAMPTDGTETATGEKPLEFADPGRLMTLADLYTQLLTSDQVRSRIPGHPTPAQIIASPLPANTGTILPIISLGTVGPTPEAAHALNVATLDALRDVLAAEARKNDIAPAERVELSLLKAPAAGTLLSGPSRTGSILALLLCVLGTIALTHLLESLRNRRTAESFEALDAWAIDQIDGDAAVSNGSRDPRMATVAMAGDDWIGPAPRSRTE
jgi:hypothetical protein